MSFWTDLRDPLFTAPLGGLPGLGYDAFTQNGLFQGKPAAGSGDYSGMPGHPGFNPIFDPSKQNIDTGKLDMSVQNFADQANRKGPSAWATMAGNQQNALAANERERGVNQANAATAGAEGELARSGGLSSGARERAAEGGAHNLMDMNQNAARQNSLNQLQIGVNDEQNKIQQLGMLPGMEQASLQPKFQNVQNQMVGNQAANAWNQNLYDQQMQTWAAGKQADATQKSGKK